MNAIWDSIKDFFYLYIFSKFEKFKDWVFRSKPRIEYIDSGFSTTIGIKVDPLSLRTLAEDVAKFRPNIEQNFNEYLDQAIRKTWGMPSLPYAKKDAIPLKWEKYLEIASDIHVSQIDSILIADKPGSTATQDKFNEMIAPLGFPMIHAGDVVGIKVTYGIPVLTTEWLEPGIYVMFKDIAQFAYLKNSLEKPE